jgi:hypothetical protein
MKLLGVMCLGVFCCAGAVHSEESEGERFLPISLKCPAENDQVLESVERQRSGLESLIRVQYVKGVATIINLFGRGKTEPDFSPVLPAIDIRSESDPLRKKLAHRIAAHHESLKAICEGPTEKRREYFDTLKANRKLLKLD